VSSLPIFLRELNKYKKIKDKEDRQRIEKKVTGLADSPTDGQMLAGIEHPEHGKVYKLRVGKYRVLYCIRHSDERVYILTVGLRENIYNRI